VTFTLRFVDAKTGAPFWLSGSAGTYAELPTLADVDAGQAWLVTGNGCVYTWSGSAWPPEADGVLIGVPLTGSLVTSVNGKKGPVTLDAEDVGAMPSDTPIPSTAADVGALPANTFIPSTAADVDALPADTPIPSTAADVGATPSTDIGDTDTDFVAILNGSGS
jgi:hypothetical protein